MRDTTAGFAAETAALRRLVELASGAPSFAFAVCNLRSVRSDIIARCKDANVAIAALPENTHDPVATARDLVPAEHRGAVFITGLELLLSDAHPDSAGILARLNRSRERWRSAFPHQLLVFWLTEQALMRILECAPDFRAWVSHDLEFTEPAVEAWQAREHRESRTVIPTEQAARLADSIAARLATEEDLPPMLSLALIRDWLRLRPDGKDERGLVGAGIRKALDTVRNRLAANPADLSAQHDMLQALHQVAASYERLGRSDAARTLYQESHTIAEHLAARDPANVEWQRDLSVSLDRLGDLAVAQGDLVVASRYFKEGKDIAERLAASDPANAAWQRDLWVSNGKLGDLAIAQGELPAALDFWRKANNITKRLAASDPANAEWQRDLSVSLDRLGNLAVAQGDLAGALRSFTESKTIAERLAASDPTNAEWQRDLSVSLEKLGDLAVAQSDLVVALRYFTESKTIRESLIASDPANAPVPQKQRDVSVSLNKLGDFLARRAQPGDADQALGHYTRSLALAEKLLADNPGSAQAVRDVSISLNRLGDFLAQRAQPGDADKALGHCTRSLELTETLLADNPGSAQAVRDVAVSHYQMAGFASRRGDKKDETLHRRAIHDLLKPHIERGMTFDPPIVQLYEALKAEFAK